MEVFPLKSFVYRIHLFYVAWQSKTSTFAISLWRLLLPIILKAEKHTFILICQKFCRKLDIVTVLEIFRNKFCELKIMISKFYNYNRECTEYKKCLEVYCKHGFIKKICLMYTYLYCPPPQRLLSEEDVYKRQRLDHIAKMTLITTISLIYDVESSTTCFKT